MRIALIGFGTVAQGLTEIITKKANDLRDTYGFVPEIVAVSTRSRGSLYHPDGLDPQTLLDICSQGSLGKYPERDGLQRGWDSLKLIRRSNADVVVEAAHTNLETGQPAIDHVTTAFENGKHVVLANKGPVALKYPELMTMAKDAGVALKYEGTVMAGTPSIQLAEQALRGCTISAARGILNGSTNYILTLMENGMSYDDAIVDASAKGYLEADPSADVDGWDAASKVIILAAALFGKKITFADMDVEGIGNISLSHVEDARAEGMRWRLIAEATPDGGRVAPMKLPISDPLAGVSNATNAITYTTDLLGDVTLIGAGAGRLETGFGVLSDLLVIHDMG